MINILMYVSTVLMLFSFVGYFLMLMFGKKKVTNVNGFDITKDIISEYDSINVIEANSYFTIYNLKRRVIKLSSKSYYGNCISDISLALIEAGISILDDGKNKFINLFRNIFNNLKILYIFPILALCINCVTYTISDAKVSMLVVGLFLLILYILVDIKNKVYIWISTNISKINSINKQNSISIINFINKLFLFDKLILFSMFLMILRFIIMLF